MVLCLFGCVDGPPLTGARMLDAFLLTVDPVEKKVVRKEAHLVWGDVYLSQTLELEV